MERLLKFYVIHFLMKIGKKVKFLAINLNLYDLGIVSISCDKSHKIGLIAHPLDVLFQFFRYLYRVIICFRLIPRMLASR